MFFSEADKAELGLMGWSAAQVGALNKHVEELYNKSKDEYSFVDNFRFARTTNESELAAYKYAVEHRTAQNGYDRTINANDGSKIQYGFDFNWAKRSEVKKEVFTTNKTFVASKPYVKKTYIPKSA